jgi:hypothetical protein
VDLKKFAGRPKLEAQAYEELKVLMKCRHVCFFSLFFRVFIFIFIDFTDVNVDEYYHA